MRAVVQRVAWAKVSVDGAVVGECGPGLLVLVAAAKGDRPAEAAKLADRVAGLRIFSDSDGKMNLSMSDLPESPEAGVLAISNFTLYGDALSSRRPSFVRAANYDDGEALFNVFVTELRKLVPNLNTGVFGADMQVELQNDGPVTLIIDCHGPKSIQ